MAGDKDVFINAVAAEDLSDLDDVEVGTLGTPAMSPSRELYVAVTSGGTGTQATVIGNYITDGADDELNALVTAAVVSGADPVTGHIVRGSAAGLGVTLDAGNPTNGIVTLSGIYGFDLDDNNYYPVPVIDQSFDFVDSGQTGLMVSAFGWLFNDSQYESARCASGQNVAAQNGNGAQMTAAPGEWAVTHTPAANTQATISRAAVNGSRHVCRSISATLIGLAAAVEATVLVNLRDGATGAGTILQSWRLLVVGGAGSETGIALTGLNLVGSDNTAMTLEFAAAGGANTFETVALSGYDAVIAA
jgi:hypothetical protein